MQTVTQLAQAVSAVIVAALTDVDADDLNSYVPTIDSNRIALVGVPAGTRSTLRPLDLNGATWEAEHVVRLQLWVKFDTGDAAACVQRARNIGALALQAIAASDGTGYSLSMDGTPLAAEVAPDVLSVAEIPYIVVTLSVTVWESGSV